MQLSNKSLGMGPELGPSRVCQDTHGDTGFLTNVSTGRSPASHKQAAATPATRRQLRLPPVYFCALLWSVKLSWQASLFSTLCMIHKESLGRAWRVPCHPDRAVKCSQWGLECVSLPTHMQVTQWGQERDRPEQVSISFAVSLC